MAWATRWLSIGVIGLGSLALTGCVSDLPTWAAQGQDYSGDIRSDKTLLARAQTTETAPVSLQRPMATPAAQPQTIQPPPPLQPVSRVIGPPPGVPADMRQVSATQQRGIVRVSVRAWVNNRPIFDDEVMQGAAPEMRRLQGIPEPQRSEELRKALTTVVDNLIDSEVMYQEAMKKIKEHAPHIVDKIKEEVDKEYDKQVQKLRKAEVPEAYIREAEVSSKRMLERNLLSTEYARDRIMNVVKSVINFQMIRDYYAVHKNEFQTVDKIAWQDIFIATGPARPTVEDVKRFAEDLIAKCRTAEDFNRLMIYNDGFSRRLNGEGLGQRRGEIKPAELEATLFQLREGDIGPVIPVLAGVHLVRVTKRDYAGQLPLNDEIQKTIRKKLESQLAEREYKRIVRELRLTAVIRIEPFTR